MGVFTSLNTKTIPVPNDPGQTVTIRHLAPKHLRAAQQASQLGAIALLREMGGAAVMKELDELKTATPTDVATGFKDPLATYDTVTLLEHGIVDWTYDRARNREAFEDIDLETQEHLAREVLRLARPALFLVAEDDAAVAQKNG